VAAINTGRRNTGATIILQKIIITTATNTGTEIGRITVGTTIAGEIIMDTTIHIHSEVINTIIIIRIMDM
jgi:hypothetical protein